MTPIPLHPLRIAAASPPSLTEWSAVVQAISSVISIGVALAALAVAIVVPLLAYRAERARLIEAANTERMRADVYEAQLQRQRLLRAQGLAWRVITEADSRWRWAETRPELAQALARGRQALFNLVIQHPAVTPELLELAREIEHMGDVGPPFHRLLQAIRQGRLDLQDWAPLADDPQREPEAAEVYRRVLDHIARTAEQTYRACEKLISQPVN